MKATMRTGVVVVVGPGSEGEVTLVGVGPVSGIGPFAQSGLDEAFGFAVGLRGVRLNPDVLDSELFAGAGEGFGEVAATIVSHDAFDGNAEAPEVGDGGDQERDGAFLLLVGEDLSTRYPGMVVDSDVDEFPACTLATAIARAATSDAVADAVEAAEFFDVEMDDFAGPLSRS